MQKLRIKNKGVEIGKYLTKAELGLFSLTLKDRFLMFIFGYVKIGTFQPEGFTAPVNFYLVRSKNGYFISYRQGFSEAFYAPEVAR